MMILKRVTTQYVDQQDRLRLSGETTPGQTTELWLTQRLLTRLLPHLFGWLEQQVAAKSSPALPAYHTEAVLGFAQQAARAQVVTQAPVKVTGAASSWLVAAVDVTFNPQSVTLSFRDGAALSARLELQATPLRQWLGMVHAQCRKAGWPMDCWPAWITESKPAAGAQMGALLH